VVAEWFDAAEGELLLRVDKEIRQACVLRRVTSLAVTDPSLAFASAKNILTQLVPHLDAAQREELQKMLAQANPSQ